MGPPTTTDERFSHGSPEVLEPRETIISQAAHRSIENPTNILALSPKPQTASFHFSPLPQAGASSDGGEMPPSQPLNGSLSELGSNRAPTVSGLDDVATDKISTKIDFGDSTEVNISYTKLGRFLNMAEEIEGSRKPTQGSTGQSVKSNQKTRKRKRSSPPFGQLRSEDDAERQIQEANPEGRTVASDDDSSSNEAAGAVCVDCALIDLSQIYGSLTVIPDKAGILVADLGFRLEKGQDSGCYLCRFFHSVCLQMDGRTRYHLRALSAFRNDPTFIFSSIPESFRTKDNIFLVVVPDRLPDNTHWNMLQSHYKSKGFICPTRPTLLSSVERIWAGIVPAAINYTTIRDWHSFCLNNHSQCIVEDPETPRYLRLIDCKTLSLITPPENAKYSALSYVWGCDRTPPNCQALNDARQPHPLSLLLPAILPRTIRDAIVVTRNLGIQYLWVDKYCINQRDPVEKQLQVEAMGDIYAGAEITLVAAFGENDDAGLPGVVEVLRTAQPSVKVGNITLVSTLQHPTMAVQCTKWNTRGWTFQEAILSRRRLIFTISQVIFECRAMYCSESLHLPLVDFHTKNKVGSRFRHFLRPGIFSGGSSFGKLSSAPIGSISQLKHYISLYMTRDLGDESDSLNACLGILDKFRSSMPPIYHYCGIPFQSSNSHDAKRSFIQLLLWHHKCTFLPRRRSAFPSWSWAGWKGGVVFQELYLNGSLPELVDFDTSCRTLQLSAFVLRPDAVPLKPSGVGRLYFEENPPPSTR